MSALPEGWVETSLGEVSSSKQYGYTESASTEKIGPKFLRITDIQHDFIDWDAVPYCPISGKNKLKYKLGIGDVVIARTGNSTGATATIKDASVDAVFASYLIRFKIDPQIADYNFIDFSLRSKRWSGFVKSVKGGSAQGGANAKNFAEYPINLPPLPEQKAIADMLSSFDEKIELLREQNKTLETLAQTIFKEWFVHFNYPDASGEMVDSELGLIPKGWRVGSLLEVFDLIGGGTPKTSIDEYWNGGISWYSVVDAPKGSETFVIETEKQISPLGLSKSSTKLLQKGTTIVSARGTVGKLALVGRETAMNQSCYGLKGKDSFGDYYVYFQLKEALNRLKRRVHGAVFDTITQSTFKNIMVSLPDNEVVISYEERVIPIMEKILNNIFQIQSLSKTRDMLLPKLMNGMICTHQNKKEKRGYDG